MNLRTFGGESTTASGDEDGMQSIKEKSSEDRSYEVPTPEERSIVHLIHAMQDVEVKVNQDDEFDAKITSSDNWAQVINSERIIGVDSKTQQSIGSWGFWEPACRVPSPTISPPLQNGWQWSERAGKSSPQTNIQVKPSNNQFHDELIVVCDPEFDKLSQDGDSVDANDVSLDDSEHDLSDGFDSDDSQRGHDLRKKNKWLRPFFESLDNLHLDQINEQARQWHCPACQDGPGAINWFIGLQSLLTHAKTKGRIRIRLHRELAELLEEELRRKGISFIQAGEAFGKWKGLAETTTDNEIVWPPMVIVMNTILEKDENDKWKGMGNQELLEYFSTYQVVKARHSYGPNGHRGMSMLIFEASAMGYLEAKRLHKHFLSEGRDRDSWERHPVLFYPGGKRQLYGFLASKEDMVIFNRHSHAMPPTSTMILFHALMLSTKLTFDIWKSCLKFEMRSYHENVVVPMKKTNNDNQELIWFLDKVVQHEQRLKALEETFGLINQKLHDTIEGNRIDRKMTIHHEGNKEEMNYRERIFEDQIDKVHSVTEEKEGASETLLQEERMIAKESDVISGAIIDYSCREEFEAEREKLTRLHEESKIELRRKQLAEETELEKSFEVRLKELMAKYAQPSFH